MRRLIHRTFRRHSRLIAVRAIAPLMGVVLTMGCSAESKQVCDHLRELTDASEFYPSRNKDYGRCVKEVNAYLKEDADGFRKMEECLMDARTIEEADQCRMH